VNTAIIYYTSVTIDVIAPDMSDVYKFMIIVGIEHAIILMKLLIAILIPDTPEWVLKQDEYRRENDGELMSEKIRRIKREKKEKTDAIQKANYQTAEERELIEGTS
jgi:hypothetical protein